MQFSTASIRYFYVVNKLFLPDDANWVLGEILCIVYFNFKVIDIQIWNLSLFYFCINFMLILIFLSMKKYRKSYENNKIKISA